MASVDIKLETGKVKAYLIVAMDFLSRNRKHEHISTNFAHSHLRLFNFISMLLHVAEVEKWSQLSGEGVCAFYDKDVICRICSVKDEKLFFKGISIGKEHDYIKEGGFAGLCRGFHALEGLPSTFGEEDGSEVTPPCFKNSLRLLVALGSPPCNTNRAHFFCLSSFIPISDNCPAARWRGLPSLRRFQQMLQYRMPQPSGETCLS